VGGINMNTSNCRDEVIVKLLGKLELKFPGLDQLVIRDIAEEVLYNYEIAPLETGLVASDMEEKIKIYIGTKMLEGLSKKTLKNYTGILMKLAGTVIKPVNSITIADLRMFLVVRCKDLEASSTNGQIRTIKGFFSWLNEEGYIHENPAKKLKKVKEPERVREPLNDEEVELLREACDTERSRALFEFCYSTGCRVSEIEKIDIADIDWNNKSLVVFGKGKKERRVLFSTKAKLLLKNYLASRVDSNPALFVTKTYPYNRLKVRTIEKEIHNIQEAAGFEKSVFPHLMRHTFATHKLEHGMPINMVQKLLGHKKISTTLIYTKTSMESIVHAYNQSS
jgi:integrase/recombinase XerD